ncbi:unnamed protein product [Rangifer tarandus platyrhynchus]|uniref:Uncharacterized protein n=1 Tax=Rangifer tarandus platyrhynchus TaxID=3082113 RepID=A0AC59YJQ0_RANTA
MKPHPGLRAPPPGRTGVMISCGYHCAGAGDISAGPRDQDVDIFGDCCSANPTPLGFGPSFGLAVPGQPLLLATLPSLRSTQELGHIHCPPRPPSPALSRTSEGT